MAYDAAAAPVFTVADVPGGDRTLLGVTRVSPDAQDAQVRHDALPAAGYGWISTEKISTRKATSERPGLSAALGHLREGDMPFVWKLDRLGRSVKEVLTSI